MKVFIPDLHFRRILAFINKKLEYHQPHKQYLKTGLCREFV